MGGAHPRKIAQLKNNEYEIWCLKSVRMVHCRTRAIVPSLGEDCRPPRCRPLADYCAQRRPLRTGNTTFHERVSPNGFFNTILSKGEQRYNPTSLIFLVSLLCLIFLSLR